jgi:GT2 family glycosyltransferase
MPASFGGVPTREARAFNSAALLRIDALDAIGGFDPCFCLDHLDSWLHHQLYVQGWRMYVLDSVHLEHHFSLLNYRDRVSLAHLRNFLAAESAYFDEYCSSLAGAGHTAQLAGRLVKQVLRRETREVQGATWRALRQRLTVPRTKRLAMWREALGGWPGAGSVESH